MRRTGVIKRSNRHHRPWESWLHQLKIHAVVRLATTFAVVPEDLHQPVEGGRASADQRLLKLVSDCRSVRWMAPLQSEPQLAHGLRVTEPLTRDRCVAPSKDEAAGRSPEPATQDVVQS